MSKKMDAPNWRLARGLAAELALRGTDRSLINEALSYLRAFPEADFFGWLDKLTALGDLFTMSKQTAIYRQELRDACQPLRGVGDNQTLIQILGWTARLHGYYFPRVSLALKLSPARPQKLRERRTLEGLVRSEVRRQRGGGPAQLAVQVGPGQMAVLSWRDKDRHNLEVGDKVKVEIRNVQSAFQFDVTVVEVLEQSRPEPPPPLAPAQEEPEERLLTPEQIELRNWTLARLKAQSEEDE
jgi:hypothetical protein